MDRMGAGQLPMSSLDLQITEQEWTPNRKRRSRKPQETFRRQNTDNDDVMSDVIEYSQADSQADSLAAVETVADKSVSPAMTLGQEFGSNTIDLYRNAVEMCHNNRDSQQPVYGNRCGEVAANAAELSMIHQFGNFGSNKHFYPESGELGDNLNVADNHELEEDDHEVAEDDFIDEDFNVYGNDGDLTSAFDPKQISPKLLSSSVTCEICERTFKGRSQLSSHMKTHRHPLRCDICSIKFTSQGTMLWHQRFVHATQKYNHSCEVCGETLRLKQDLMSHYMTHRLPKGVVKCSDCGQSFRNTATLKLHEMNACLKQGQNNYIGNVAETLATGCASSAINNVALHGENTVLSESLSSSYSVTENGFADCDRNDDANGDENLDCGDMMSYSCPFCGQTFYSKGLYTIHTKKHTKPHSCDLCGRGFAKKFTMECHRKTHLGQKDYRCDLCGQAFTLRPQLSKHRAENHEMANGVSCRHCDAKFKHQSLLKRHVVYYCPKAPSNKDGDCVKSTEPPESEHEHQCAQCDKTFDTQWALEEHAKYHQRKYSCDICGNKYGERYMLQSHLLTHLGVRPYKCTVCGASFTMKAHCERHCRMHLRVQHFECESCGYMFRYEPDRITHISKFCLGAKEDNPDMSKMMTAEKIDFAQLGMSSSMLGYTSEQPTKSRSPLSASQQTKQNELTVSHSEDMQLDALANDVSQKESTEDEELNRKLPLKCYICDKKLRKKAMLTVHLAREHGIGEEPFKCFICGQGAPFEKAMRLHLESHLPYKLYGCSSCGVRFSYKRSLASHELNEKCFQSSKRPSESNNSESYNNTEIVYVDEDLSLLPLKPCNSEMDLNLDASWKANSKDKDVTTEDESGGACENSSEFYSGRKIKDEIADACYERTNHNSSSSVDDDDGDDDDVDDDDDNCEDDGNDNEDDETICDELSPPEDCEQDNSVEQGQNEFEDIGEDVDKEQMTDQYFASSENERLISKIKKEKNGTGYKKIQAQDEESFNNSGNTEASDGPHDEENRKLLLNLPLRVKVLRDSFGNERVFVNGELFPLWCDYALQASRTSDVGCRDFKEFCEICHRFIVGKYKYRVHMQRHSHERPFACDICNKAFKTTENLRTHMRWHDPTRLIVCSICGAKCVSPSDMKRHMTVHEGTKPYVCSTCGKGFRRKMYLNTHVRTHTGETPFSCDICGRRFRIYSSLHDHQKLHSGYKPFECSVCLKRFAQRANWRTHERRHKGVKNFECEVCQKGFVQNYELQNHRLRCVKQDLPYMCLLCGMKFTKEHPLKRHINRHSCGICGKQFVIMKEKVSHQLRCRQRSKSSIQEQL